MKQNRIDEIKDALKSARKSYEAKLKEIRGDSHYSDNGKSDLIANAYAEYMRKRESLKDELEQVKADERARLERQAFNAPKGNENSYREAVSKASSITDRGERERTFQMAVKTNDTLILKAMAAVAHGTQKDEQSWGTVIAASKYDKDISALVSFEQDYGNLRTAQQKLAQNMELSAPMKPAEASQSNAPAFRDASR